MGVLIFFSIIYYIYEEVIYMKEKEQKPKCRNTPGRIIYSPQEISEMERKEKERIFWKKLLHDGLGGKKGHDN